jgi:hypothetical protein
MSIGRQQFLLLRRFAANFSSGKRSPTAKNATGAATYENTPRILFLLEQLLWSLFGETVGHRLATIEMIRTDRLEPWLNTVLMGT